jgi:predicted nucleotidyltransferase
MQSNDRTHSSLDAAFLGMFCEKWRIRELSLFGSVLRPDFSSTSDIDILVEKEGLRNPYRRREILNHREILYVA